MLRLSKIHHVAIICSDYEQSKKFYTEIMGFNIIRETYRAERKSYKLDLAVGTSMQIELFSFSNLPQRPSHPEAQGLRHLAFEVADLNSCVLELTKKDVPVESIRIDQLTGKSLLFSVIQTVCHWNFTKPSRKNYGSLISWGISAWLP